MIFVFGSNLAGRHGKGAALHAFRYYGAIPGQGWGPQGNSYAIPTKDRVLKPLPLREIRDWVQDFLRYAKDNKDKKFLVTPVGTGLAGYSHWDIAPMFYNYPENCEVCDTWQKILHEGLSDPRPGYVTSVVPL